MSGFYGLSQTQYLASTVARQIAFYNQLKLKKRFCFPGRTFNLLIEAESVVLRTRFTKLSYAEFTVY
ncbi:hypothetical protein LEP1GSC096_0224 [Leptospira interrogans serovar Hebdomadis str. R499]|nr:hypothetical protein LEP1GSC096_0224 [Leptospira interrogans serovar Hebdomadis str. R499]OQM30578.1 hypothetical protein DV38_09800 [Leptospira interrogans]